MEDFENGLLDNVRAMNVCCAMTVSTPVTRTIIESMAYVDMDYVPMPNGLRIQVLKTMSDLPRCHLHHFAAFLEDLMILVVWDDDAENLLHRAEDLEAKFVEMTWGERVETSEVDEEDGKDGAVGTITPIPASWRQDWQTRTAGRSGSRTRSSWLPHSVWRSSASVSAGRLLLSSAWSTGHIPD